jgi:hypothetical protein
MGTVIENNLYFSNLLIIIEDHPVVLSLPFYSIPCYFSPPITANTIIVIIHLDWAFSVTHLPPSLLPLLLPIY